MSRLSGTPIQVTLDQLAVLEAIDASGSFAGAGRALHRTTSVISYSVGVLEQALGVELFDRSGHRAMLTGRGARILDEARRVLAQARHLEQVAKHLDDRWETRLGVVVDGVLPQEPVMRAFRMLAEERAPTRIELWVEYLMGVPERFERDDADLMLVLDFVGDAEHEARALDDVPMLLLAHRTHPLASMSLVTRSDLVDHVELAVEDSSPPPSPNASRSRRGSGSLGERRKTPRLSLGSPHHFRLSDFSSKRRALLSGVGFGWMPQHLVEAEVASGELVELAFAEGSRFVFRPQLVHRRTRPLGRAASLFVELLLAA